MISPRYACYDSALLSYWKNKLDVHSVRVFRQLHLSSY